MTLLELKAFFLEDGAEYTKTTSNSFEGCAGKVHVLVAEAVRLQARVDELEELEREGERIRRETLDWFMEMPLDEPDDVDKLIERIHALESAGAAAFNGWRIGENIVGPMHVLREVVGVDVVNADYARQKATK
jgi:hypothetical protein